MNRVYDFIITSHMSDDERFKKIRETFKFEKLKINTIQYQIIMFKNFPTNLPQDKMGKVNISLRSDEPIMVPKNTPLAKIWTNMTKFVIFNEKKIDTWRLSFIIDPRKGTWLLVSPFDLAYPVEKAKELVEKVICMSPCDPTLVLKNINFTYFFVPTDEFRIEKVKEGLEKIATQNFAFTNKVFSYLKKNVIVGVEVKKLNPKTKRYAILINKDGSKARKPIVTFTKRGEVMISFIGTLPVWISVLDFLLLLNEVS